MLKHNIAIFIIALLFSCSKNVRTSSIPNNKYPDHNFSKTVQLKTCKGDIINESIVDEKRFYLKIRCNSIPLYTKIDSAFIYLKLFNQYNIESNTFISSYKILEDWNANEITWRNQPKYNNNYSHKLKIESKKKDYYKFDIKNFIQDVVNSKQENYGFMFKILSKHNNTGIDFYSSNARENDNRPKLIVYYK